MLRRRKTDAPFLRQNLVAGLCQGVPCEVDLVLTADGHAVCLHDRTLDRETSGRGRVADATRASVEQLCQRGSDGAMLSSAPLFLDEVAAAVHANGAARAQVQLDIKARADAFDARALDRLAGVLGGHADAFIASAYDWDTVRLVAAAVPGLRMGFDPLALYGRSLVADAGGFRDIAARMFAIAPGASIYYLEAKLILAALEQDVNLVDIITAEGAEVDAWTIDADHPRLHQVLRSLVRIGCQQITSNDPDAISPLLLDLMRDS
jgi:glycerophosphoryl diester phosphodiesterase